MALFLEDGHAVAEVHESLETTEKHNRKRMNIFNTTGGEDTSQEDDQRPSKFIGRLDKANRSKRYSDMSGYCQDESHDLVKVDELLQSSN